MAVKLPLKDVSVEKPSVLVLDDEDKICEIIRRFLVSSNMFRNVVVADTVSIALMKIRNEKFDLIIVDYNLPDKKGTHFIDIVSKSFGQSKIKFLLISGFLDNKTMADCVKQGVKHVLVKPFTRMMLMRKVSEILKVANPYEMADKVLKKVNK
ncbi:MAG: response regulator [Bacteriovoracaceae bacterium]|nr:response regulator [Bacteriovoracaceae bacterium]